MTILVFIRELSFKLTKVLDNQLEVILSAIYALMTNTKNKALRKECVYTLRTLAKYSSDVKLMYFIVLMPPQMFTKFKLANTYCLSFILQKENLNILVFEETLLTSLIKIASELFADAHKTINDLGEGIVVDLFKRFMDRKKADVFLKLVRTNVSQKRADQILKFLRLNFDNIEEIVEISRKMQAVEKDIPKPASDSFRMTGQGVGVFGRNALSSLGGDRSVLGAGMEEGEAVHSKSRDPTRRALSNRPAPPSLGLPKRNHQLQDELMDQIQQLLSS
jgi:hypothetical protein